MNLLRSIAMAFSMFSKLPAPRVEWKEENMQYMLASFPLVGAVVGLALWAWCAVAGALHFGAVLTAAGLTVLPVLLTGGIHLDGFCDTVDALSSHGEAEKKRAILKDSHAGAFAIIFCCVYFLVQFALYTEAERGRPLLFLVCLIPVMSRCLSGLTAMVFPVSGGQGLLRTFRGNARRTAAVCILAGFMALAAAAALCIRWEAALAMLLAWAGCGAYVFLMSRKQFGGMSGDLSGFLLQLTELMLLFALVIMEKVVAL